MIRRIAQTCTLISLATVFGCSSSSGSTGPSNTNEGNDASSQGSEDSGASGNSGGEAEGGSAACPDPLQQVSTIAGKALPAACTTCVEKSCSSSLTACSTASCEICGAAVYECASSSCSSSCFPTTDGGTVGSTDAGGAASDAGNACATLMSCSGCALVNITMPGTMAACTEAISNNQTAICQGYLTGIHAVSPTTCD